MAQISQIWPCWDHPFYARYKLEDEWSLFVKVKDFIDTRGFGSTLQKVINYCS